MIHVAAVAVPLSWLDAARRSEAFRAAWIFAATPTDVGKVAFWTANVVVLLALPYLMLVGIVLFLVLGGGWNAFGHAVNLVLVVNVVVNAAAAVTPRMPFSASPAKSREVSSRNLVRDLAGWSLAFLLLPALLSAANVRLWSGRVSCGGVDRGRCATEASSGPLEQRTRCAALRGTVAPSSRR